MNTIAENNWLLTALVFTPLAGALLMVLIPEKDERSHKQAALITSLLTLGLAVFLLWDFDYSNAASLQYFVDTQWIEVIGAGYTIGVDGMSLPLIALTALIMPLVFVYSWHHIPEPGNAKAFLILSLILETGMIGTFVAQDLVLFFVFFEVVLLPMFFMIAVWGGA
ncbi:MAG: NADH-quinone oxidoreductase subunit M, partial [Acidimicrobiaceae bacterium]|nr:NADH-quinone oxidoreductase subunit M [Acidimicrobiaceae bacterium]